MQFIENITLPGFVFICACVFIACVFFIPGLPGWVFMAGLGIATSALIPVLYHVRSNTGSIWAVNAILAAYLLTSVYFIVSDLTGA